MLKRLSRIKVILIILTSVTLSCTSVADTLDPAWTPEMFFKNAQEAMGDNRYKDALFYFDVFLVRYPEDIQRKIAVEYEQAFIHYKIGEIETAKAGFHAILKKYEENPYAMLFHPQFKRLCEIGLNNIEKSKAVKNKLFWRVKEKKWAEEHD